MTQPLTARQRSVFEFICRCVDKFGYPPTVREICAEFGLASTNGATDHLKVLEKKGYITRVAGRNRALQICREKPMVANAEATAISLERKLANAERRADVAEQDLKSVRADLYKSLADDVEHRGIMTGAMFAWILREKAKEEE